MDNLIYIGETPEQTELYVTELSAFTLQENGMRNAPAGLYLCEENRDIAYCGLRVLAHVPDLGAAYRIIDLMFGGLTQAASCKAHAA